MTCEHADCPNEATALARSIHAVAGGDWAADDDHVYCAAHFVPGTATHLGGAMTQHAAMSVDDA
jgi:hypothetical protein